MNSLLTGLGISPEIQAFFNVSARALTFDYRDQQEYYEENFHLVPSTQHLWTSGPQSAIHVIISHSVMEIIAFITLKRHCYPQLERLAFVAIGNRFHLKQSAWIRENFPGRKFTLVFGKDLIGHITDIKLTASLKNINIQVYYSNDEVRIYRDKLLHVFNQQQISLHSFQEAFAIRPRLRTAKPARSLTFLDQLKHGMER